MIPQISTAPNLIPGMGAGNVAGTQSPNPLTKQQSPPPGTSNAGSAFAPNSLSAQGGGAMQAIQAIMQILVMLLSALGQSGNPAGNAGGSGSPAFDVGGGGGGAPAGGAPTSGAPTGGSSNDAAIPNKTDSAQQNSRLNDTLSKVAKDPEGSKLLEAAKKKGYTIEVGDPTQGKGGQGKEVNGVTLSDQKKIIINPNAPDFDKTVVHELVHAATDGDGDSQQEEGIADVIGYRVANRMDGKGGPGDTNSIYQNKMSNYKELGQSNSVRNSLAALGINAGV